MSLRITRDQNGTVTITDEATGRSETVAPPRADRIVQRTIAGSSEIPTHSWGQLPSHSWGQLA